MPAQVILATGVYRPGVEAIAQEIGALEKALQGAGVQVAIFQRGAKSKSRLSLLADLIRHRGEACRWLRRDDTIAQVFATSRAIFFHLLLIGGQRSVLTLVDTDAINRARLSSLLRSYQVIIIETEEDQEKLVRLGCAPERLALIRPFSRFEDQFDADLHAPDFLGRELRLLMASLPFSRGEIKRRGIDLLLAAAGNLKEKVEFSLPCRSEENFSEIETLIRGSELRNIRLLRPGETNLQEELNRTHAVIYPLRYHVKACPHSLLEGLSWGRPALVANSVGFARIIKQGRGGEVFVPQMQELTTSILHLRDNYWEYQSRARKTYDQFFSAGNFLSGYMRVYEKILGPARFEKSGGQGLE